MNALTLLNEFESAGIDCFLQDGKLKLGIKQEVIRFQIF